MRIEMVATGEELLDGRVANTNTRDVAEILTRQGLSLQRETTVGDAPDVLKQTFQEVASRADVVLVTGGLGPTDDDRTTEVLANLVGVPLELNPGWLERLEQIFAKLQRPMSASNRKQAYLPAGATLIDNPRGTAAGFSLDMGSCRFFVLPGVPREMQVMMEESVVPVLLKMSGGQKTVPLLHTFQCFGLGESQVADQIGDLYPLPQGVDIGYRAKMPEVHLTLKVFPNQYAGDAQNQMDTLQQQIRSRLATAIYSENPQESFVGSVGQLLRERGETLVMAESCTGGLVGSMLTEEAGSSDFFLGSFVTYSNELKHQILGVEQDLLQTHGAVSAPVARAMAEGARRVSGAHIAASITGIAGPGGGTPDKPVGTVHIAVASASGTEHRRFQWIGGRSRIRLLSAYGALQLVRYVITGNMALPLPFAKRE